MSHWIMTFSGKPICPLDPDEGDIQIEDIAHSLAMICRWAGHCHTYYSVAEHSIRVAKVCGDVGRAKGMSEREVLELEMLGLMHDATEAYVGDIPRPIKSEFMVNTPRGVETFREMEAHLYAVIESALGLPEMTPEYQEIVHVADNVVLSTEARDIANPDSLKHEEDAQEPLTDEIRPLKWEKARLLFLLRYASLYAALGGELIEEDGE